jgi:hypothetical protein
MIYGRQDIFGNINTMELNIDQETFEKQLELYQDGMLIQDAFPMLSVDEREFIMTGLTPEIWDSMMHEEDE